MFRSKAFHIIMPVIFVGAAVILGFLSVRTFVNIFEWGGAELSAPGESTVDVHKAGGFKFWNKVTTVQDGKLEDHPHEVPSGTVITIRRLRDGETVPWVESIGMRMTTNGDSRVSFGSVSFTEPGRYQVTVSGFEERRVFYLAESREPSEVFLGFAGFILAIGLGVVGVLWALITLVLKFIVPWTGSMGSQAAIIPRP